MLEKDYIGFFFLQVDTLYNTNTFFSFENSRTCRINLNDCILCSVVKQGHNMVGTTAINYEGEFEM